MPGGNSVADWLAGSWLSEFSRECQEPGFVLDDYLNKKSGGQDLDAPVETLAAHPPRN